jgi:hypothetical protein
MVVNDETASVKTNWVQLSTMIWHTKKYLIKLLFTGVTIMILLPLIVTDFKAPSEKWI